MRSLRCVVVLALLAGCPPARLDVECAMDSDCNLDGDVGVCTLSETSRKWCAYPDLECPPTGYRYSDYDVEDAVGGKCVGPALTVQLGGKGTGSVFSNPPGIRCTDDSCTGRFPPGTIVQLSAETTTGAFLGWIDGCRGQGTCAVTMDNDRAVTALFGSPGEALWAKQLGASQGSAGDIAIDTEGNLIVVGSFSGTITSSVGMGTRSDGGSDIFVAKLAASTGATIWIKRFGGAMNDGASNVAVDSSGEIYVSGGYQGTVDFGDGPRPAEGSSAFFALKLHANGDFAWVRRIGSPNTSAAIVGIAANSDAVSVGISYDGFFAIDNTTFTSAGRDDFIALKMSVTTGATSWAKSFGGENPDILNGLALTPNGDMLLTGWYAGTVNYGGDNMPADGFLATHMFLLKLGVNGNHLMSTHYGQDHGNVSGDALVFDAENNIVIAGNISTIGAEMAVGFGCGNTLPVGIFLLKLTSKGECVWVNKFAAAPVHDIIVNSAGEIATTGGFTGAISFGGQTLTSTGDWDAFVARFTRDGVHLNSSRGGGANFDRGRGIAQGNDGRLFVSGFYTGPGSADFSGETLTANGSSDAFIVAHSPY